MVDNCTVNRAITSALSRLEEQGKAMDTIGNGGLRAAAAMADKPAQRTSLKEKLAAYKAKVSGAERADTDKAKRKEETL